jgi:hypothetical protein
MLFRIKQKPLLFILLVLDAFVMGGCVTLVVVNQFLNGMMKQLVTIEAQSQILDVLDHLIPYYVVYGGLLLLLILITISVWVWATTESWLRYAVPLVFILITAGGLGWVTISRSKASPIPPRTPTPTTTTSLNVGPGYENSDFNRPFPTSTASAPLIASTSSPTPTKVSRRIPLRRSGSNITGSEGQSLYHLVKEEEIRGDEIAETLSEDEMMCVQHFDLTPTQCICWIGPLENAGVRGAGTRGMRRITILDGSAEEAALAMIEDWGADLKAAGKRKPCTTEHLTVSYDGGLFKPVPYSNEANSVTPVPVPSTPTPIPIPPALTPTKPLPTPTWTPEASDCILEAVPPQLSEIQPAQVAPGDEITVIGSGGYLRDNCGGYNESARNFQLYFDDEPVGVLSCYVNHCEASLTTPANASPGVHCISVAVVGCEIDIQVISN